jgi:hypothetical protein
MHIELDLNHNDAEALFRHCLEHKLGSGDPREDARLRDALRALQEAIVIGSGNVISSDNNQA